MSKIASVGSAMTALKGKLEQRADAMLARVALLDKASDEKFALADHALDLHDQELKQMEDEIRQLGNFPPLDASGRPSGNGAVETVSGMTLIGKLATADEIAEYKAIGKIPERLLKEHWEDGALKE